MARYNPIHQTINVDFSSPNFEYIVSVEGDLKDTRTVTAYLYNNGVPYSISDIEHTWASVTGVRRNGTCADNVATIVDESTVEFSISDGMQAIPGQSQYCIKLINYDTGEVIKSCPFTLYVNKTSELIDVIIHGNDFKTLRDALIAVKYLKDQYDEDVKTLEDLIEKDTELNETLNANEAERQEAEKQREESEELREALYEDMLALQTGLNNMEDSFEEAEKARVAAENERIENEAIREAGFEAMLLEFEEAMKELSSITEVTFGSIDTFPVPGLTNHIYIDTTHEYGVLYYWDIFTEEYKLGAGNTYTNTDGSGDVVISSYYDLIDDDGKDSLLIDSSNDSILSSAFDEAKYVTWLDANNLSDESDEIEDISENSDTNIEKYSSESDTDSDTEILKAESDNINLESIEVTTNEHGIAVIAEDFTNTVINAYSSEYDCVCIPYLKSKDTWAVKVVNAETFDPVDSATMTLTYSYI